MSKLKKSAESSSERNRAKMRTGKVQLGLAVVVILVVTALLIGYHIHKSNNSSLNVGLQVPAPSSSDTGQPASNPVASLTLNPAAASVTNGQSVTVKVWEDSMNDQANAVQANITYPADKFDFVSVNTSGSAFSVAAPSDGGSGVITIARGTIHPVNGKQLLASFTLKAKAGSGTANIEFAKGSAVMRSTDNKNTLKQTYGGTYTLTQ